MNGKMTLNDGTELNGFATSVNNLLVVYIMGITLTKAFGLLDKPAKTTKIVCERNGVENAFEGFTHLSGINEESSGIICATLKKE